MSCNVTNMDVRCYINSYYESIVHALHYSSCLTVHGKRRGFYKYWWYEELTLAYLKKNPFSHSVSGPHLVNPAQVTAFDEMKKR